MAQSLQGCGHPLATAQEPFMLTHDQIIANVKEAFWPLSCDAKIWDFDSKLRFKIMENGNNIVRTDEVDLDYARDEELLASILKNVRARIQSKGYNVWAA